MNDATESIPRESAIIAAEILVCAPDIILACKFQLILARNPCLVVCIKSLNDSLYAAITAVLRLALPVITSSATKAPKTRSIESTIPLSALIIPIAPLVLPVTISPTVNRSGDNT